MLKYKNKVCLFSKHIEDRSVFFIEDSYFIMKKNHAYYLNGGYIMALDDYGLISKKDVDILTTQNQARYNKSD